MPVTPSKVAEPSDARFFEEEDIAIHVSVARKVTRCALVDETKPLVMGDWLRDKDIITWPTHKLYHNEIGELRAWTTAVTCIVSRLYMRKKHVGSHGISQAIVGLAWRRRHIFIVNSEGLLSFVCAIDFRVPIWAFKMWIWEPFPGTSLVQPILKRLQQNGVSTHAWALGYDRKHGIIPTFRSLRRAMRCVTAALWSTSLAISV